MLLYSLLHLAQVKRGDGQSEPAVSLNDIRQFRQLHSPCAGHPEYGEVTGAETTTGPLGQGIANSVGMAIAAAWLAARYNQPGLDLFGFNTYALCSDGDLMEGVGHEAASLAGHLQLNNLCWIYDDNRITIEGRTDLAFSEDVARRFQALGWQTVTVDDANDMVALEAAFERFQSPRSGPLLIIVRSVIGYGAPTKQDTASAHGAPLGPDEVRGAKEFYGWPTEPPFHVPPEAYTYFEESLGSRGKAAFSDWTERWDAYQREFPELAGELRAIWRRELPSDWQAALAGVDVNAKSTATRNWSGKVLQRAAGAIPWLLGGSADLAESNKSLIELPGATSFSAANRRGRNFHFGVREHAMAAICNGMALSGLRPYAATFFVFTDYLRPAMRLSALMKLPVMYLLTHDSIGLGEDGPTHQPIEHLAACRAIPNLLVMRPADAAETRDAYAAALAESARPTALILTRQTVPNVDRLPGKSDAGVRQGGYVLWEAAAEFDVILMGTGSEVQLCLEAAKELNQKGVPARVVSLPCWELFLEQPESYRLSVLPAACQARVAVEAGVRQGWDQFLGPHGAFVGMSTFGASAPAETLYRHFGLTAERVVETAQQVLANLGRLP